MNANIALLSQYGALWICLGLSAAHALKERSYPMLLTWDAEKFFRPLGENFLWEGKGYAIVRKSRLR